MKFNKVFWIHLYKLFKRNPFIAIKWLLKRQKVKKDIENIADIFEKFTPNNKLRSETNLQFVKRVLGEKIK